MSDIVIFGKVNSPLRKFPLLNPPNTRDIHVRRRSKPFKKLPNSRISLVETSNLYIAGFHNCIIKDSSRPADDFYKSRTRQIVSQIDRVQKNNLKINWAKIVPLQRIYTSNLFLIASTSRKNWAYLEMWVKLNPLYAFFPKMFTSRSLLSHKQTGKDRYIATTTSTV